MTRNDTSYRQQGRAIVLAALMVLSVFGASVAFTGAATADDPAADSVVRDNGQLSGIVYAGEDFNVTLDTSQGDSVDEAFNSAKTFNNESYLVRIDSQSSSGTITSVTAVDGPYINESKALQRAIFSGVDTQGLETGTYTIANDSNTAGSFGTAGTFSINQQSLDASFDSDSANSLDTVNVTLDSGRDAIRSNVNNASYNVTVSADGLDADQLQALFAGPLSKSNLTVSGQNGGNAHVPFDALGYSRSSDTRADVRDDGYVTLDLGALNNIGAYDNDGDQELVANFTNLDNQDDFPDEGSYEFDFRVTDADQTTASDSIEVGSSDVSADFKEGVSREEAGDIAGFNLSFTDTDSAYVQIGGESAGFVDVLYVEQDDEEPVQVDINTRLLGTNATESAVYDTENTAEFISEAHGASSIANTGGSGFAPSGNLNLYGDDGANRTNTFDSYTEGQTPGTNGVGYGYLQDLLGSSTGSTNQTVRPLQPTDYQIIAADSSGLDGADEAVFDADPGGAANNQLDSKTLTLTQPSIEGVTVHRATEDAADATTEVEDLLEEVSLAEDVGGEVALDDRVILQVEASGVYGAMVANMTNGGPGVNDISWSRYTDGEVSTDVLGAVIDNDNEEGIDFSVESEATTGNQGTNSLKLEASDGDTYVVMDEDNNQFFVIADTSSDSAFTDDAPEETTEFTAELTYDGDVSENRYELDTATGSYPAGASNGVANYPFEALNDSHSYPYILHGDDNTLSASASFDLSPRSVSFDNLNDDGVVQVPAEDNATVTGETNVAPGTDAEIRLVSSTGNNTFQLGDDVDISDDGSISAQFDLGEYPSGTEFNVNYRVAGGQVSSVSGELVESVGEDTTDEGDDEQTTNETDTDDGAADDGAADDGTTDDGSTDDGTPGFGAVVALVALVGAALLAVRRQN